MFKAHFPSSQWKYPSTWLDLNFKQTLQKANLFLGLYRKLTQNAHRTSQLGIKKDKNFETVIWIKNKDILEICLSLRQSTHYETSNNRLFLWLSVECKDVNVHYTVHTQPITSYYNSKSIRRFTWSYLEVENVDIFVTCPRVYSTI